MIAETLKNRQTGQTKHLGLYVMYTNIILGEGSQAVVYKGKHLTKKYEVAIKAIKKQWLSQGINSKLLQYETQVLSLLKGKPNVLNLLDIIKQEESIYIITELCYGDLSTKCDKKLSQQQVWKYIHQLIRGYSHLFQKKVIHKDLKLDNLFLNAKGEIKIGDFGFATTEKEAKKLTSYNIGSPQYMAPEALKKNLYSYKSDVWGIGMIFYQLVSGDRPFKGKSEEQIEQKLNERFIEELLKKISLSSTGKQFLGKTLQIKPSSRMDPEEMISYFSKREQVFLKENKSQTAIHFVSITRRQNPEQDSFCISKKFRLKTQRDLKRSKFLKQLGRLQTKQPSEKEQSYTQASKNMQMNTLFPDKQKVHRIISFEVDVCGIIFQMLEKFTKYYSTLTFIKKYCLMETNNLVKCYSGFICSYLQKLMNLENTHFQKLSSSQLQFFLKSEEYTEIKQKVSDKVKAYRKNREIQQSWNHAQEQKIQEVIKATKQIIARIALNIKYFNVKETKILRMLLTVIPILESIKRQNADQSLLDNPLLSPQNTHQQENFKALLQEARQVNLIQI